MTGRATTASSVGHVLLLVLLAPVLLVLLVIHVVTWPFTGGPREVLYRFWRPLEVRALQLKPDPLAGVEPELLSPVPRPLPWLVRPPRQITGRMREALNHWDARRAWVTRVVRWRDAEGPEVRAWICYEAEGRLLHGYLRRGFDAYHGYMYNQPWTSWFDDAFREGGTMTVLTQPGRPRRFEVFGEMELYLDRPLSRIVTEHEEAASDEDRERLLGEIGRTLDAVLPWAQQDEELRRALSTFSRTPLDRRITLTEIGRKTFDAIRAGTYEPSRLETLSELCSRHVPGRWAAT
jgi:hypothetical protein